MIDYPHDVYDANTGIYDAIDGTPFDLENFRKCLAETDMAELDDCLSFCTNSKCPLEAFQMLVEAGADPNARSYGGETSLMMAVSSGDAAIVQYLLSVGADVNIRSDCGNTALCFSEDYPEIKDMLERASNERTSEEW